MNTVASEKASALNTNKKSVLFHFQERTAIYPGTIINSMEALTTQQALNRKYDLVCFDFDGTLAVANNNLVFWSLLQQQFGPEGI